MQARGPGPSFERTDLRALAGSHLLFDLDRSRTLRAPPVSRWSLAERRELARVIRAKGGRDEYEFIARFAAHAKLQRALFGKR